MLPTDLSLLVHWVTPPPHCRRTYRLEFLGVDEPVAVPVEDLERLPDLGGLVHVPALARHHLQELVEVDGAVAVHVELDDKVEDLVLGRVLADGPEDGEELLRRDRAAAVLQREEER